MSYCSKIWPLTTASSRITNGNLSGSRSPVHPSGWASSYQDLKTDMSAYCHTSLQGPSSVFATRCTAEQAGGQTLAGSTPLHTYTDERSRADNALVGQALVRLTWCDAARPGLKQLFSNPLRLKISYVKRWLSSWRGRSAGKLF